jgi:hypothetical protein
VDKRLDDQQFFGLGAVASPVEDRFDLKALEQMPLCERIAYQRAIRKGLQELQASNQENSCIENVSLYNYPAVDWEK